MDPSDYAAMTEGLFIVEVCLENITNFNLHFLECLCFLECFESESESEEEVADDSPKGDQRMPQIHPTTVISAPATGTMAGPSCISLMISLTALIAYLVPHESWRKYHLTGLKMHQQHPTQLAVTTASVNL